jgi:hypothetical protein
MRTIIVIFLGLFFVACWDRGYGRYPEGRYYYHERHEHHEHGHWR